MRPPEARAAGRFEVLVIGASTGGPVALVELVAGLPANLPVPVVLVQHMPPQFTRLLAERLSAVGGVRFREAVDGATLHPGEGWVAPGGKQLVLGKHGDGVRIQLTDDPPENSCKPAVDVLFRTAVAAYGRGTLALVLTGMGNDGLNGAQRVSAAGGVVLAQDEASSVVWGMPGAVVRAGLAQGVLPLSRLSAELTALLGQGRAWAPGPSSPPRRKAAPAAPAQRTPRQPAPPPERVPAPPGSPPFPAPAVPLPPGAQPEASAPGLVEQALRWVRGLWAPRQLPGPVSLLGPGLLPAQLPGVGRGGPPGSVELARRPPAARAAAGAPPRPRQVAAPAVAATPGISHEAFEQVRRLVYAESAIVLEPGKEYLVESRLLALARRESIPGGVAEVMERLSAQPRGELARKVVEAITTNETSFFRDQEPFEVLRDVVLPELVRRRAAEKQLRIWCAASSSGQEPYSVAMLLRESFPHLHDWRISVTSSDISRDMLRRCDDARYTELEVNRGLTPERRARHFTREGNSWRARPELRQMVQFFELNLAGPWPAMAPLDLVLMRNVLIYFDAPTKRSILAKVRKVLRPDGYLFLGGAETTFSLDEGYAREAKGRVTYYRLR